MSALPKVPQYRNKPRTNTDWTDHAACRPGADHDPALWFDSPDSINTRTAVRICRTECPVVLQCRAAGLRERAGVWGGNVKGAK
jgi:hypothetical protein